MTKRIRLCLDLNIWCGAFIANKKQHKNTACQELTRFIRQGFCDIGEIQLIVSWGMLNRLKSVLVEKLGVDEEIADLQIDAIKKYSELGPGSRSPQITLGGTGLINLPDEEDAHVIETALAGKATALVTLNFKHFTSKNIEIIIPNKHHICSTANNKTHIVHPFTMMDWIRNNSIPSDEINTEINLKYVSVSAKHRLNQNN
ncbi:MAG: PIN domain-containing protein [Nodularia sp. (in: cyanobacteria)]|nr:PIN domain-containing protein [Nodularia sp. (in: cyanobacteria)]